MLEIRDLTCGYGEKFVLHGINLKIEDGELIGIIGPNGSGKTTLLKAITGILKSEKGEIFLKGENIRYLCFKEMAQKIAVVSQNVEGNFMTVEEFVLMGRIPHYRKFQFMETEIDMEIVRKYMLMTDTLKYRNQPIEEISGGEKQLAVIARALAQEPQLLLLDEPTSHLDIKHQITILDLIKKLNKASGITVMMVLHELNLASEYCDRLILLNNGMIYKEGEPAEVLTYRIIEKVYETIVVVEKNPISHKPYILIVPEDQRHICRGRIYPTRGFDESNPYST